jgi:hypothetical protein
MPPVSELEPTAEVPAGVELTFLEQPPAMARLKAKTISTITLDFIMKSSCGEDVEEHSHPFFHGLLTHLENKV